MATRKKSKITKTKIRGVPQTTGVAKRRAGSYLLSIGLLLVIIVLAGSLFYMYHLNNNLRSPKVQSELAKQANQDLLGKVSQIILVPKSEKPTIAQIVNVDNLKQTNPDFYEFAQNGDRLIIYSTRAIIYREEQNKVINVAPVIIKPGDQNGLKSSDSQNSNQGGVSQNSVNSSN